MLRIEGAKAVSGIAPFPPKSDCAIHCDGLISLEKSRLTDYVGELSEAKKEQLNKALQIALALPMTKP